MLRINKFAATKLITAYHAMSDQEEAEPGSQSHSFLETLWKAEQVCSHALELSDALGCEPDIILSDNLVEELTYITHFGKI